MAMKVVETERTKDRNVLPLLVVMSDGRANVAMGSVDTQSASPGEGSRLAMNEAKAMATTIKEQRIPSVVIDTETEFLRLSLAGPLSEAMDAPCITLEELRSEALAGAVRLWLPSFERPRQE